MRKKERVRATRKGQPVPADPGLAGGDEEEEEIETGNTMP